MKKSGIIHWLREERPARLEELYRLADETRRRNVGDEVHLRGLIEVSNCCVRDCAYCGLRASRQALTRYRMNAEEILGCVRKAVDYGYGTVVLQSGEDYGVATERVHHDGTNFHHDDTTNTTKTNPMVHHDGRTRTMERIHHNDTTNTTKTNAMVHHNGQTRTTERIHHDDTADTARTNVNIRHDGPTGTTKWMAEIIRRIKSETDLAVTLSLGERPDEDLACWRAAGADRYLLRFETSDPKLYERIHPPLNGAPSDRIAILRRLGGLGYEVGSGVMIGIPGQTYESLAEDIEMFRALDLDMIGVGPYLPHPETPLGRSPGDFLAPESEQVPNTEEMTYKVLALTRLACPRANIPSTTALATLNTADGRELGLRRGANVVMPNLTPLEYRALYEIYPGKACIAETAEACQACLRQRILSIGRKVGTGPGGSLIHHDGTNFHHDDTTSTTEILLK